MIKVMIKVIIINIADLKAKWSTVHSIPPPDFPSSAKQSVWDKPAVIADKDLF